MRNDLKQSAKREARVWLVAMLLVGAWLLAVWLI